MKEQTPDGYVTEEKLLQFSINENNIIETERYDWALEIKLDKDRAESRQWMITLHSENKARKVMCADYSLITQNLYRFMLKMLTSSITET